MFIKTSTPHEVGSFIDVTLHVPGLEQPIKIHCKVVHAQFVNAEDDDDRGIGVQFVRIDDESRDNLVDFIKSQKDCT
jgi:Tfp pilus assembly protein PilZ